MGTADTPKLCGACGAMHPSTAPCTTTSGLTGYPAQPQPRGEGDDLAARTVQIIRNRAKIAREQGTTEAQIIRARALDEAANEFADILPALRASTHPEQPARETNLRMNRWREHLGDDPLDGFGGRGPAEYHYMATHEPEGPGLTRFGNRGFRPAPPRGEGDDLAARLESEVIGYSISLGLTESQCDLLHAAASRLRIAGPAQPQPREEGEARVDG